MNMITLEKINALITKKKYAKALELLKKIKLQNFNTYELSALCLFNLGRLPQAKHSIKQAILFAQTDIEKISCRKNHAAILIKENNLDQAAVELESILIIDDSVKYAEIRNDLCEIYFNNHDYRSLSKHAIKLLNINAYSHKSAIYLLYFYHETQQETHLNNMVNKLIGELTFLSSECVELFVKALITTQSKSFILNFLEKYKNDYQHTTWYQNTNIKLCESTNNINVTPYKLTVEGDNIVLINKIVQLKTLLESQGAYFSEYIQIVQYNDMLSINAKVLPREKKCLINIPLRCMPLISDFDFNISDDDQLIATPKKNYKHSNPNSFSVMSIMIDIYNHTNKISKWRLVTPYYALKEYPELLTLLASAKGTNARTSAYLSLLKEGNLKKLLIETFLASRMFSYKKEHLKHAGIKTHREIELGLLAIIDFINHSMDYPSYQLSDIPGIKIVSPTQGCNGELFVKYNFEDPVLTFLNYGFVDTNIPWMYSVPCEIKLTNGLIISIDSQSGFAHKSEIPDYLLDCQTFVPSCRTKVGNKIKLSSLMIPRIDSEKILIRALTFILLELDTSREISFGNSLEVCLTEIIEKVICVNLNYWDDVQRVLNKNKLAEHALEINKQVTMLINVSKKHFITYRNAKGLASF